MTIGAIDVRDLIGHPGMSRAAHLRGTVPDLGTELAHVPEDAPIAGELLVESVVEGILVSGTLTGTWRLRCARCLTEIETAFDVRVSELFATAADPAGDEYPFADDGTIDPDQMVRDAIGVELPFSPLCRPDCRGLCPVCGGDLNEGECPGHDEVDPRFAVLSGLFPDLETTDD